MAFHGNMGQPFGNNSNNNLNFLPNILSAQFPFTPPLGEEDFGEGGDFIPDEGFGNDPIDFLPEIPRVPLPPSLVNPVIAEPPPNIPVVPDIPDDSGTETPTVSPQTPGLPGTPPARTVNTGPGPESPNNQFGGLLQDLLTRILEGSFGFSDDAMQRQKNLFRTEGSIRERQGLSNLASVFNTAGQLGGGQFGSRAEDFSQGITDSIFSALTNLDLTNEQFAQSQQSSAFNQAINLFGTQGQLDLGNREAGIRELLGMSDIDLRRQLGLGNLALGQQGMDINLQRFLAQLAAMEFQMDAGGFGFGGFGGGGFGF